MTRSDKTLGDLVTLQRGHDLPEQSRQPGTVPVIGSAGPNGFHNVAKQNGPGVTVGRSGASIGKVTYVAEDYWPHNACLYVTNFKGNHPRYTAYLLSTLNLGQLNSGAAQPSLNRNFVYSLKTRIPTPDEQKRIADILSAYDELIENNRRRIKLLEEAARQLYREWFVRLRFPGHEHTKIVDGVPEGWEHAPFSSVVDFKEGPGLRNFQYRDSGIPFLNIRTFGDDEIDFSKIKFLDEHEVFQKYNHFLLEENDHVVSSSGTLGRVVTIRKCHLPLMLNTSLIRMRPRAEMKTWFLKTYLKHGNFLQQVSGMATGAAQLNYGPVHLKKLSITLPPKLLAKEFEDCVEKLYIQIKNILDQNVALSRARDILLPRLMDGRIVA